jgi:hypothetical protein
MKECKRCIKLQSIILDIHWMARRYADGRQSYAGGMFNRAMDDALALGVPLKEDSALTTHFGNKATYYADDGELGIWKDGNFVRQ